MILREGDLVPPSDEEEYEEWTEQHLEDRAGTPEPAEDFCPHYSDSSEDGLGPSQPVEKDALFVCQVAIDRS